MTTTLDTTPTGRAIRTGSGYGPYHAETAYPNGDTDTACHSMGPHFTEQTHPVGWDHAAATMPPGAICQACIAAAPPAQPEILHPWQTRPWDQLPADYRHTTTEGVRMVLVGLDTIGTALVPWYGPTYR